MAPKRLPRPSLVCEGCGKAFEPDLRRYQRSVETGVPITKCEIGCGTVNPPKVAARRLAMNAKKRGELVSPGHCEKCGIAGERLEMDHRDYSKPLDVQWLCHACHWQLTLHEAVIPELKSRRIHFGPCKACPAPAKVRGYCRTCYDREVSYPKHAETKNARRRAKKSR